jgi:colanic acid biosynthesis glycosyl transferase WcaI
MKPRLIVCSELYYPDESATGYVLTKIAEGLSGYFAVRVLCGFPPNNGRPMKRLEERSGVAIERCKSTRFNKNVVILRFLNVLTLTLSLFWKAMGRIRADDSVLVVTNPPTLPFAAWMACWFRGARCYLLIHDVYPEVLTVTGMLRRSSIIAHVLGWCHRELYRNVDAIVVLGRDMHRLVMRKVQPHEPHIALITNWADLEEIVPSERNGNRLLEKLALTQKFVVQYSGNLGRTHGIELIFEAAKLLREDASFHFLVIGSGAKKEWLEEQVLAERLLNVTLLPPQRRQDLPDVLNACDVALISFVPGMAGVSVPSRMYNVMAAGKSIIAAADEASEIAMIVNEEKIGWLVPPDRPDLLVETIQSARLDSAGLREMGRRARVAVEREYSLHRVLALYRALLWPS